MLLTCLRFVHSTQLRRCRRLVCLTLPPALVAEVLAAAAIEGSDEDEGASICRALFTEIEEGRRA